MSTEENKAVIRRYYESFGGEDSVRQVREAENREAQAEKVVRSVFTDYVAPDCVFRHADGDMSFEDEVKYAAMFQAAFPDFRVTVDEMVAEGDRVVTLFTMYGTHEGQIFGVSPTGKQVTVKAVTMKRIANGKLVEEWSPVDILPLMQQIGANPPQ